MAGLAVRLAQRLGLAQADVNALAEAALLHDIGLEAMAPDYHSRPAPLGYEQRLDLWRHSVIGEQQMAKRDATRYSQLLVRWHHEWWDGSGYPDGLAFEDIPIGARILRVAELFSALIGDRPYRRALTGEQVLAAVRASAGIECDPYVINALLALLEDLRTSEQSELERQLSVQEASAQAPQTRSPEETEQRGEAPAPQDHSEQVALGEQDVITMEDPPAAEPSPLPSIEWIIQRTRSTEPVDELGRWTGWIPSRYSRKSLLGFEISVLRQFEFRSISIPFSGSSRLECHLKGWRKIIHSNDPRGWAAAMARATIEPRKPLGEDQIARLLENVYVPAARLGNPQLRRWFGEMDSWWLDNLRRSIDLLEDETARTQALAIGLKTGDYALSFNEETLDLKLPLTTVFWRFAGRDFSGPAAHPDSRVHSSPVREFITQTRSDLLYLNLPPAHGEQSGREARNNWRRCWVDGPDSVEPDDLIRLTALPQSKHAYLTAVDRLLRAAAHIKMWAVACQDVGLASARDISELIKEHRPVTATYSKDVSEVVGGLRSFIIAAEK
jgi:hypothetical protein